MAEAAANTILIDFSIDSSETKTEPQLTTIAANITGILKDHLEGLTEVSSLCIHGGGLHKLFTSDRGAITNLRIYENGLVTINIDYYKGDDQEPLMSYQQCREFEQKVVSRLVGIKRSQALVPVKRGTFVRYFPTSDERLLEYDIDALVFEQRSPYQKVQIVHSKMLGNMLILDDLQNLSEADLIYTETIMMRGKEDYKDKEIVILGGGDGALLYELLKEKPKFVTMLEIDEVVMEACSKYMRSVCGDTLDKREGDRYKIVVGDCMKSLEDFIREGRKFDFVFGDLTDIPISDSPSSELWKFIIQVLEMSFKILRPNGKYMTHAHGACCVDALKNYEDQLSKLNPSVTYTKATAFVPSFLEDWVFYQIKRAEN